MLRFHDTATERVEDLVPRDPGSIGMYVCGPTVYGAPHVGHGRVTLVYDVLRRYLTWRGLAVNHVSNITDIDDKIINRANAEGRGWRDVAEECEALWWDAMDRLGVERPTTVPHATDYVEGMVRLVDELVRGSFAYETSDGVYLESAKVAGYGLLAHQSLDSLRAGSRVEVSEEKRSPVDFALWKKAKPNEPTWESPWGQGRPGWHTECVVMSLELLGDGFDIHGGGLDLTFPHHENERAQAVALGRRFATHWIHNGLVVVGEEKMSKSLGNFLTLEELLSTADPRSYRLLVLQSNYRSPLSVTPDALEAAASAIERLDALARRFDGLETMDSDPTAQAIRDRFREAMDNDLDSPTALAGLFDDVRRANALGDQGDVGRAAVIAHAVLELFGALGLRAANSGEGLDARTADLVARRDAARAARDFASADALRGELEHLGWHVEDTPAGTRVYR